MPIYHEQWKQAGKYKLIKIRLCSKKQSLFERLTKKSSCENSYSEIRIFRLQSKLNNNKKIYDKLACVPYERILIQCANNYGVVGALKNQ